MSFLTVRNVIARETRVEVKLNTGKSRVRLPNPNLLARIIQSYKKSCT